jgi:hypothetical protein
MIKKVICILFILFAGKMVSQQGTVKFDPIFSHHCPDTLRDLQNSRKTYVLTINKEGDAFVTAYKGHRKKWSEYVNNLFGDNYVEVNCIEFYKLNDVVVIRVFGSTWYEGKETEHHRNISLKDGKWISEKTDDNLILKRNN